MHRLFFRVLCAAALSLSADTTSIHGKWQVYTSIGGNDSDMVCTFTQKADTLTGSCAAAAGNVDISGKVDSGKVTWSYKSEYQGTPLTVNYAGAMTSETRMKGSVEVPEFSVTGDFTANQAQ